MYTPSHFEQKDVDELHQMMFESGMGTLVTFGHEGIEASHAPMFLEKGIDPSLGTLYGHLARANGQWKRYESTVSALAIFLGPNAYVTPSWYATKQKTGKVVPTWNYKAVHAYGDLHFHEDAATLNMIVTKLTEQHESSRQAPWKVTDAPKGFTESILKGVIGFSLKITKLQGAWKLSQNRGDQDFDGVQKGLASEGRSDLVSAMEQVKPK